MPLDIDFHIPFPSPRTDTQERQRVQQQGLEWAHRFRLIGDDSKAEEHFLGIRLDEVAVGFYPQASGDDLDLMMNFIIWTVFCDDYFERSPDNGDEARATAQDILAALTSPPPNRSTHPSCPLTGALSDLWPRMCESMSPSWQARARRDLQRFVRICAAEVDTRQHATRPTVDAYMRLRHESMATDVYLNAAERAEHYEVSERFLASNPARKLHTLQKEIIAFYNDVHSVEREEHRGDPHNFVLVLEHAHNLTREQSISLVVQKVHERSQAFLTQRASLTSLYEELAYTPAERRAAEEYVSAMVRQIKVSYDWSLATNRYQHTQ